jgi:dolichol-phosphate mannosyltransferase
MIYYIIPAYNEAANLPELLSSLRNWSVSRNEPCHLVVVDDGSQDATADILATYRHLPITVVRHEVNRGVHEVFRSGFRAWSELRTTGSHDLVITVEADNTSSLEILDRMVARAREGDDVVLASCYAPGGEVVGTNVFRWVLSFCANLILRCTPGMPRVYTFSSFYRVYRAPFLQYALRSYGRRFIEEQGFVCVVEMLLKFGLLGARISEVPLRLDGARRKGASKMKVLWTIRGYLLLFSHAVTGRVAKASPAGLSEGSLHAEEGIGKAVAGQRQA